MTGVRILCRLFCELVFRFLGLVDFGFGFLPIWGLFWWLLYMGCLFLVWLVFLILLMNFTAGEFWGVGIIRNFEFIFRAGFDGLMFTLLMGCCWLRFWVASWFRVFWYFEFVVWFIVCCALLDCCLTTVVWILILWCFAAELWVLFWDLMFSFFGCGFWFGFVGVFILWSFGVIVIIWFSGVWWLLTWFG